MLPSGGEWSSVHLTILHVMHDYQAVTLTQSHVQVQCITQPIPALGRPFCYILVEFVQNFLGLQSRKITDFQGPARTPRHAVYQN